MSWRHFATNASAWVILGFLGPSLLLNKRKHPLPIDAEIYKWRHLIENFFAKLKAFKAIAMRSDKTDRK